MSQPNDSIPAGLCQCGCGKPTQKSRTNDRTHGYVAGEYRRYVPGHHGQRITGPGPNPSGLCQCGCGERTAIATRNSTVKQMIEGQPFRYLPGHQGRKPKPEPPNPSGLCQCGCGEATPIAPYTMGDGESWVRGEHTRFIPNHHSRAQTPELNVRNMGHETPCHLWTGLVGAQGYGVREKNGKRRGAHVVAWEEAHGPVPDGHVIHHRCGVRLCVRVDHLQPLTNSEHGKLHEEERRSAR